MASLKEIKGRIASVGSTLKITSAMKMVASAKLHKAQNAMGNMLPYQERLLGILSDLLASEPEVSSGTVPDDASRTGFDTASRNGSDSVSRSQVDSPDEFEDESPAAYDHGSYKVYMTGREVRSVALVCFSSNSSLCGGFNANAVRAAMQVIEEYRSKGVSVTVYSVGRKMAEAMRKAGYSSPSAKSGDLSSLVASPSYDAASALGVELEEGYLSGRFDRVEFIYNHFKSTASQPTVRETYLPFSLGPGSNSGSNPAVSGPSPSISGTTRTVSGQSGPSGKASSAAAGLSAGSVSSGTHPAGNTDGRGFIVEPSRPEQIRLMLPKVLRLKVFTVLLDTVTAEHAARTVAMQMATDNGNELLQDLTLEYNKGRQQKITSEILDLEGGVLE